LPSERQKMLAPAKECLSNLFISNMETISKEQMTELITKVRFIYNSLSDTAQKSKIEEEWLGQAEIMRVLKVSKRTLQNYRDHGRLPFAKKGSKIYYRRHDIDVFLNRGYVKAFNEG
jgi:hypothetical protein